MFVWLIFDKTLTLLICLFIYLFVYLFIYLFIYLCIYLSIYLIIYLFIYLFIYFDKENFNIKLLRNITTCRETVESVRCVVIKMSGF